MFRGLLNRNKHVPEEEAEQPTRSGVLTSSFSIPNLPGLGASVIAAAAANAKEEKLDNSGDSSTDGEGGPQRLSPEVVDAPAQVDPDPTAHGCTDADRYETIQNVNSGSFGTVAVARDRVTGELVAIKLIPRGHRITSQVINEILNHRRFNHFHAVKLKRVILTQKYLGIVMEYCSGGDMYQFVLRTPRGLDEASARWFFQQMVIGMDYSHRLGVVHRDIKLKNMVLQEVGGRYLLKLCDFGFSKDANRQSVCKTRLGTLEYMAPELLRPRSQQPPSSMQDNDPANLGQPKPPVDYDGKKIDTWSLGVALFFMLTRSYPYDMTDANKAAANGGTGREVAIMRSILEGPIIIPTFASRACQDVLARMLHKNPTHRISLPELVKHPFFLESLPRGAELMNDNEALYRPAPGLQTAQEIRTLCLQASRPLERRLSKLPSGLDDMQIIDDTIDDMMGPGYDPAAM